MKTIIIYDEEGYIITQNEGNVRKPAGVPYLEVEIPADKILTGIDVTVTPNVAIFEDYPKSSELDRLELLESVVNDILLS